MVEHSVVVDRALDVADPARFSMTEDEFRSFYGTTVHPLRGYLARLSGDLSLADGLAQEVYCRFLEVATPPADADGCRRYVFRIATNLFHDHYRRTRRERSIDAAPEPADHGLERRLHLSSDVGQALECLKPRQRALLWLAYVEGLQHREIADVLGLSALTIRPLLFRARRRLAHELRSHAAQCAACGEVALVVGALAEERRQPLPGRGVADAGLVWWKAQLKARYKTAERATRPIAVVEILTLVLAPVAVVLVLAWAFPQLPFWTWTPGLSAEAMSSLGGLGVLLAVGAAGVFIGLLLRFNLRRG